VFLCVSFAHGATDATISGTVKDPAGAPFKGAFVQAQNMKTRIYVNVLSDKQGRYRILGLKPGEYEVLARAVGFKSEPRDVKLVASELPSSFRVGERDSSLERPFRISSKKLLPEGKGKQLITAECFCLPRFPISNGSGAA